MKVGGVATCYSIIVNRLLKFPNSHVESYSKRHIAIHIKDDPYLIEFKIEPKLKNQLHIQWKKNCYPTGYFKHSWLFNEKQKSQEDIISEIESFVNFNELEQEHSSIKIYPK